MNFLGDMGTAHSTMNWLKSQGHDAKHLRDEGLIRLSDEEIFAKAKREDRIILTFDLGFGDIVAAAGTNLPSVIIFRLQDETPPNVNRRLDVVLREAALDLSQGAIISVDEYRYRIRRLPIITS
jgi:predicted nuclease of predicted toxin-antitoxin system